MRIRKITQYTASGMRFYQLLALGGFAEYPTTPSMPPAVALGLVEWGREFKPIAQIK